MANKIVSQFMIASRQGINTVMFMAAATLREEYAGNVTEEKLEAFIADNFSYRVLLAAMNSLWNQFLIVYADGEPAGYAKVTSEGIDTKIFNRRTVIRIVGFSMLKKFTDDEIKKSLFEKCLCACRLQQVILVCSFNGNSNIEFFESYGFKKYPGLTGSDGLGEESPCLVKEKDSESIKNPGI
jgi:hypothetical protein